MAATQLVIDVASALRDEGVSYCHWKSNAALAKAEMAETDLDLLIARSQFAEFNQVLARHGFVAAERAHIEDAPGVVHYFGYDPAADKLVHIHAHFQLVIGHDRTKNYRLPIESDYLESAATQSVLPVPAAEFEYVVLVVRMILKYAVPDEILWAAGRGRRAGPTESERRELDELRGEADRDRIVAIVEEQLSWIGRELFESAERVAAGETSLLETLSVGRRMQSALAAHARTGRLRDATLRIWRRLAISIKRRSGSVRGFHLASGGAVIAILGGDGSGKSTALTEVARWLSSEMDVRQVHLGKPPWSLTTYAVRAGLKVATLVGFTRGRQIVDPDLTDDPDDPYTTEYRRLFWYACKARDRYREYKRAMRAANRGAIVLSDRFPHPALRATDVPQIARLAGGTRSRIVRRLMKVEDRYHSLVTQPDLVFVLVLDPEESARRKTDEDYDYVKRRAAEIWDTDWTGHDVYLVDASRSREAVASEIKRVVWHALS